MAKRVYFRKYKLNEDVNIPPELSDQYLSVKKQIEDKMKAIAQEELKFSEISKKISQLKSEISIFQKNLIAIENKAKALNKEAEEAGTEETDDMQKSAEEIQKAAEEVIKTIETSGNAPSANESVDLNNWWKENVTESLGMDDDDDFGRHFSKKEKEELGLEGEEDLDDSSESLEGDYAFSVTVIDEDEEEDIIAKFYKDEDDDFWKARVVQGSEEPIESMQFDPDMNKVDIIEHLATIFDEVIEMDVDEYEEDLDDKEFIDDLYYGEERVEEGLNVRYALQNLLDRGKLDYSDEEKEGVIKWFRTLAKMGMVSIDGNRNMKVLINEKEFILDPDGSIFLPTGKEIQIGPRKAEELYQSVLKKY